MFYKENQVNKECIYLFIHFFISPLIILKHTVMHILHQFNDKKYLLLK